MPPSFEEDLQKLKDALAVNMAMSLRHEDRLKEHQKWLDDSAAAYAYHRAWLIELDERLDRISRLLEGKIRGENGNQ